VGAQGKGTAEGKNSGGRSSGTDGVHKAQLQVVEKALETAALMFGTDKSRGYCLEMICADVLAGASFEMPSRK
jgi:hypothetical protein